MNNVQAYRIQFRKEILPAHYSGRWHLGLLFTLVPTAFIYSLTYIEKWEWQGLLAAIFFVFSIHLYFYWIHRFMLHKKMKFFNWAYKMHVCHHRLYDENNLAYEQINDIYMLLNPPFIALMYYFILGPIILVPLYLILPPNLFWYIVSAFIIWYGLYEAAHFIEHQDDRSKIFKFPPFRWLQNHHRQHHNHKIMNKVCFDITFPFNDYIFGSIPKRIYFDKANEIQ